MLFFVLGGMQVAVGEEERQEKVERPKDGGKKARVEVRGCDLCFLHPCILRDLSRWELQDVPRKTIQGSIREAREKIARVRCCVSPTHLLNREDGLRLIKLMPLCFANAFAKLVFPVPGGPNSTPHHIYPHRPNPTPHPPPPPKKKRQPHNLPYPNQKKNGQA